MWRFFARTHALRTWQLLPARTLHARVLFALSHSAPALALQNFLHSKKKKKGWNESAEKYAEYIYTLFMWRPKCYFYYSWVLLIQVKLKILLRHKNLLFWVTFSWFYWKISSVIARVWRTQKTLNARTFARTNPWSFAPPSHLDFRTHACDARTHVRTLRLWYLVQKCKSSMIDNPKYWHLYTALKYAIVIWIDIQITPKFSQV